MKNAQQRKHRDLEHHAISHSRQPNKIEKIMANKPLHQNCFRPWWNHENYDRSFLTRQFRLKNQDTRDYTKIAITKLFLNGHVSSCHSCKFDSRYAKIAKIVKRKRKM